MKPAVFLDRDGTVNREVGYLHRPGDLRLVRGSAAAIARLNQAGFDTVLITNQAGIGRGYFAEDAMHALHRVIAARIAGRGAVIDAIYFCPHHPDDGCACRKPQPGMLLRATRERRLDIRASFMVGDKCSDLEAGRRAGCRTVLVLTGYGRSERRLLREAGWRPDHVSGSLGAAVAWILTQVDGGSREGAGVAAPAPSDVWGGD